MENQTVINKTQTEPETFIPQYDLNTNWHSLAYKKIWKQVLPASVVSIAFITYIAWLMSVYATTLTFVDQLRIFLPFDALAPFVACMYAATESTKAKRLSEDEICAGAVQIYSSACYDLERARREDNAGSYKKARKSLKEPLLDTFFDIEDLRKEAKDGYEAHQAIKKPVRMVMYAIEAAVIIALAIEIPLMLFSH